MPLSLWERGWGEGREPPATVPAKPFDNGVCGVVDLSDLVGKGVFAVWRDPHIFQQLQIGSFGELAWLGKIDLCPDSFI